MSKIYCVALDSKNAKLVCQLYHTVGNNMKKYIATQIKDTKSKKSKYPSL